MTILRFAFVAALLAAVCACSNSSSSSNPPSGGGTLTVTGTVTGATKPVSNATVTAFVAGNNGPRRQPLVLGHVTTNASGAFTLTFPKPSTGGIVYVVARGGSAGHGTNSAIGLIALAGTVGALTSPVTLNEFSTVADSFALAQFADATGAIVGASSTNGQGIANAATLATTNLAASNGTPAAFWPSTASCMGASPAAAPNCDGLERLNSLANVLAACIASKGSSSHPCRALFALTLSSGSTLAAAHSIALNPWRRSSGLFALASANHTYAPALGQAPSGWPLGLYYVGNGSELDGPGQMAIDAKGNVWTTNNYVFNADHTVPTCGGTEVPVLTPTGSDYAGAPFSGGGISGAGWGIAIDLKSNVWVGNFGFFGKNCATPPSANSVTELSSTGAALSPSAGYTPGPVASPQGVAVDQTGNVWIANFGQASVTEYPGGNPSAAKYFSNIGVKNPFNVAVDSTGRIWLTSFGTDALVVLGSNGVPIAGSPFTGGGLDKPLGAAIDSMGNIWVANSKSSAVSAFASSGTPFAGSPFSGGGVRHSWGIAIDGNDNVWVANFSGYKPRISELCGARAPANCPSGKTVGSPITPPAGYASSLLQRQTGIQVDASGNLWVCDNWLPIPIQTNPGGTALVEYVGIAGPVKVPLLGPPQQP